MGSISLKNKSRIIFCVNCRHSNSDAWYILFITLVLAVYLFWFYFKWPIWEDQAVYHYVAWGMLHGMKPYVDTVEVNFPGAFLIHGLANLISGSLPAGLRLIDTVLLVILSVGTYAILAAWKVTPVIRCVAIMAYIFSYFSFSFKGTFQRESLALPFIVISALPWIKDGPLDKGKSHYLLFFLYGGAAGFAFWIKPVVVSLVLPALLVSFVSHQKRYAEYFSKLSLFCTGILTVSIIFIMWLACMGSLQGFWEHCIKGIFSYTVGCRASWRQVFSSAVQATILSRFPSPLIILLIGTASCIYSNASHHSLSWRRSAVYLFGAALFGALIQGKAYLLYHYIPVLWAMCVLGAVLIQSSEWAKYFGKYERTIMAVLLIISLLVGYKLSKWPSFPTPGVMLANEMQSQLNTDETIVTFGFGTESLLCELKRITPFKYINGWTWYCIAPPLSQGRAKVIENLNSALNNMSVRYFVVEKRRTMDYSWFQDSASVIIDREIGMGSLKKLGFIKSGRFSNDYIDCDLGKTSFEIYERI